MKRISLACLLLAGVLFCLSHVYSQNEQELEDLKGDVENLHKAIVAKIGEYDKNLLDVGTEIKAMEKVFQKVLPELTGSVSELSRITKGIKTKKKKA